LVVPEALVQTVMEWTPQEAALVVQRARQAQVAATAATAAQVVL
jgi:hypothetical protein